MTTSMVWGRLHLGRAAALTVAALVLAGLQVVPAHAAPAAARGCSVAGTSGSDRLVGTHGRDGICGRGGDDRLVGRGGNDRLTGGPGDDRLAGSKGHDRLAGGPGDDVLVGGAGNDRLDARDGAGSHDILRCGPGNEDRAYADPGDTVARTCEDVVRNDAPTSVVLSGSSVAENQPVNTVVGTLSATDPDAGDTHTYALVVGAGSGDNGAFNIAGSSLRTSAVFDFETKASYAIRVRVTDQGGLSFERQLTITVSPAAGNRAPTNLVLSASSIAENQPVNSVVGTLSATDPDAGDTHTYSLVAGAGSADNASFNIAGSSLRTSAVFDFETKASYAIRVRVTDQGGLTFEKQLTITVTDAAENRPPTNLTLSSSSVAENQPVNTVVGTLSATDPDAGNTHTYALVAGPGATDNGSFNITGTSLRTSAVFDFETKASYAIRVRVTDQGGLTFEKQLTVTVTDVAENRAPTDLALSSSTVAENQPVNTVVGTLSATDPDAGNTHTFSLVAGAGSTDNASFNIAGGSLRTSAVFDFETKTSYAIRVRVTDQGGLTFEKQLTITVTDVTEANVAPVLAGIEGGALGYTEQAAAVPVTTALTAADTDDTNLESATVDISAGFQSGDALLFTNQNGITGAYNAGTGVLTLTGTGSVATYQTALRSVTFRNPTHDNPGPSRTIRFEVNDGTADSNTVTRSVAVTAVDDVPVAVNNSATVAQGAAATAIDVLANDTDVDGGPKTISSAGDPANGTVTLTGPVGARTGLTYQPDTGYCNSTGGGADTFSYTLNGGSSATVSVTVTCPAANQAPVIAAVEIAGLNYTENDPATVVTATGTVTDPDSADFAGGALTVDYSLGGYSDDEFGIRNQGTGVGQIGVSGSNVSYSGTVVGTFTGGSGQTDLVVTLDADATPAATQALLRNITYRNISNQPSSPSRTVRFVLTDGDGGTSRPATRDLTVTRVDDAPVAVNNSATVAQNAAATAVDVLANDTDVDGGPKTITSANDPLHGTVVVTGGGTGLTYQPDAGYCNTQAGGTPDTFTYTLNGGSTATVSITVTCPVVVNQAPVIDDIEATFLTYTEGDAAAVLTSTGTVTDADSPNFDTGSLTAEFSGFWSLDDRLAIRNQGNAPGQIAVNGQNVSHGGTVIGTYTGGSAGVALTVTLNASATPAATQALLRNITYRSVSADPAALGDSRRVRFRVSDGDGASSAYRSRDLVLRSTSANPVLASIETSTPTLVRGSAPILVTGTTTVTDSDSPNFNRGVLRVAWTQNPDISDYLEVRHQGNGPGQFGVSGSVISYQGATIAGFTGGTGGLALRITFNSDAATPAVAQALLRNITYRASANATPIQKRLEISVTDGDGGTSNAVSRRFNVTS